MDKNHGKVFLPEPRKGFPRLVFRLRQQGPIWIIRRLQSEWVLPTTKSGKKLHKIFRRALTIGLAPFRAVRSLGFEGLSPSTNTLYAFYDLKVEPITFDVLWFLTGADINRRLLGLAFVHIVIVPGPKDGVRPEDSEYEVVVDRESRHWRIPNILVQAFGLLSTCSGYTVASSRAQATKIFEKALGHVYPETYEPMMPNAHHPNDSLIPARSGIRPIGVLCAGVQAKRYAASWILNHTRQKRLVTITLRDYSYHTARNSNIGDWVDFLHRLDRSIWAPVLVLDTERTLEDVPSPLQDFLVFKEVSWNVGLRMALYELAWLNLGVNNGPMALCWLNEKARYITFKMVTPGVPQSTVEFNSSRGFEPDQPLPFATPFQKWVWENDDLPIIVREFERMVGVIESGEKFSN